MTRNIRLLDCTLRDGGYINDWEFGHDALISIFERQVSSGVDVIEIGFLDQRRPFDMNRSIMPDSASAEKIYGKVGKENAIIVGMIDFGTCDIDHLQPCSESYLDGIRVIFKKRVMKEAIAFCHQVKALGYKVFTQAVSITSYNDDELLDLVNLVNELQPFAVSMVDTYGLLHQENLMHIFHVMDAHLLPDICLAYHAHNNFQLGYANSIEILSTDSQRDLLVDGTLYGMGKSAGNTPIELLAMYMNENLGKHYDINQIMEAIEVNILDIYREKPWGYNFFYYVSASNKCHPNYVSYLMEKRTLSVKSINEILSQIKGDKKLLYDKELIEKLYVDYQRNECDDTAALDRLEKEWSGKNVLVLGPGRSIVEESGTVHHAINSIHPVVVAINSIPHGYEGDIDYLFITNSKRYAQLSTALTDMPTLPLITMSNVTKTQGSFTYVLNYSEWIDPDTEIPDNSLVMLLKILLRIHPKSVMLAGFDGYSAREMNYYKTNMEYSFAKEKADYLNTYVKEFLKDIEPDLFVSFVTSSRYQSVL